MTADPSPRKSPVEARTMLIGIPIPVVRVTMEATSKAVIAVMKEVSLIDVDVAFRLNRFVNECIFCEFRHVEMFQVRRFFFSLYA